MRGQRSQGSLARGTWWPATAAAAADSGVISTAPCTMLTLRAVNGHATDTFWLMIFDATSLPADTTPPRVPAMAIAPGETLDVPHGRLELAAGLTWAASTTQNTLTVAVGKNGMQCSAELA